MSLSTWIALLVWPSCLVIFMGFIVLLRYIDHRERMVMINRDLDPNQLQTHHRGAGILRAGLITFMVGVALSVSLYPIGSVLSPILSIPSNIGPWLLPGLIPTGVGIALIGSYYLGRDVPPDIPSDESQFKD